MNSYAFVNRRFCVSVLARYSRSGRYSLLTRVLSNGSSHNLLTENFLPHKTHHLGRDPRRRSIRSSPTPQYRAQRHNLDGPREFCSAREIKIHYLCIAERCRYILQRHQVQHRGIAEPHRANRRAHRENDSCLRFLKSNATTQNETAMSFTQFLKCGAEEGLS